MVTRRRFVAGGLLAGAGLVLSRFLPPLADPARAQCVPGCGCVLYLGDVCDCGVCCESWAKDRCERYATYYWNESCVCSTLCYTFRLCYNCQCLY